MGYIKKLKNNELVGGTDKITIYPVTSTEAVFEEITEGNESSFKSQKTINKEQQDELDDHEERIQAAEAEDIKSITINGSTKKFEVDDENNVDLTIYTVDSDPEMPSIADNVGELRNVVGTSTPVLETSHKTRIENLENIVGTGGTIDSRIATTRAELQEQIDTKQIQLHVGSGLTLDNNGNLSATLDPAMSKVVTAWPSQANAVKGLIYLKPTSTAGVYEQRVYNDSSYTTLDNITLNISTDDALNTGSANPLKNSTVAAQIGYFDHTGSNDNDGSSKVKNITATGFTLPATAGGAIKIKMKEPNTYAGTQADPVQLQFNNVTSTKKTLLYNHDYVSASNTWEEGEVISVYYDGTNYQASNAQGGGGKAEKIKYDNSQSGLAADNVQDAIDEIQESVGISPLCYDDSIDSDLDIGDISGNILAMFANGDVIVKNFHSGNIGRFPQFSESNPYAVGDFCTYNRLFYKFTSAHLGAWDEADVERVTVLDLTDKQIYPVDFTEYDLGFEDEYGNVLVKFSGGHIYTKNFNSETAAQGRPYPPLNLYRLNRKTYEDIVTSWTEGTDYVTSTDTGVSGGLKLNRQYAMVNRQLVYDFSLASGSSACFGTKVGIASGQYMGTDDFIRIGTDGNIQTFTYNQYSSATATKNIGTATVTADTRYRLIIDKCGEWNKDKTKITILTFDLLETVFETELLQSENNNLSFYDYPFCFCESGTVKLYDLCVKVSNVCHNRKLAIFGDSITEGWMAGVDGWAHLVARHIGKAFCQVSGRDTSRIDDVIARVRAECASNPPQYIMVTVGTNSGNTLAKLQSLIDLILSYNSIPILNHVSSPASANSLIDQAIASYPNTFIGCCKMDEAVALGDSYSGTDGTHPNTTGHNLMYQQVIKDMPELFD